MTEIRYVSRLHTYITRRPGDPPGAAGCIQTLLGQRLHADPGDVVGQFIRVATVPDENGSIRGGYIDRNSISARQQLKVFYVDVGQGDATLVEAEGALVVIDGGPNRGFFDEMEKRLAALRRADRAIGLPERPQLLVNAVVVSHFDLDHYYGLVRLLESPHYRIGCLYHNGLPRYDSGAGRDLDLGDVVEHVDGSRSIGTDLSGLDSARALLEGGGLRTAGGRDNRFARFLRAAVTAAEQGRLGSMRRLYRRDPGAPVVLRDTGPDLEFEVLAPLTTRSSGAVRLPVFPDPHDVSATNPRPAPSASHTINGNSVVLRLTYGGNTFLFGGDLNQPAQRYLRARYGGGRPCGAEVNKACHHGSSDFDLDYLRAVHPHATVFSSGDNGSHDHPLPDAMGAAARHSRGDYPLVFSTELARETGSGGILLGHINARSNGREVVMAQKKEKPSLKKTWHAFRLPYDGPFGHRD